jgi:hypothetical protein
MSDTLETIKEEPIIQKKKGRPFKTITNEEPFVPKPRGRPRTTDSKIPRKTKEELRAYYREYYEEHKDEIMQKRAEYKKTPNYKQLRHEQNARYKAKVALRPKVCLIDVTKL